MGGSDGDTQYKLSSEPPDTQICDGILFTPRRGQASYRFSLTQTMTFTKLFVWFLNKINLNIFFFNFGIWGSTDLKILRLFLTKEEN